MKNLTWKVVVIVVVVLAVVYLLPTIDMIVNDRERADIWPRKEINLGLDLQGGMHLILEVDTQEAVKNRLQAIAQDIQQALKEKRIRFISVDQAEDMTVSVRIKGDEEIRQFENLLETGGFEELRIRSKTTENEELHVVLDIPDKEVEHIEKWSVDQALETIRNRIDQFGVREPEIRRQGEKRILIQLAGIKDTKRAKELIGKTALLEFKLVDESKDPETITAAEVPPGSELLYEIRRDPQTNRERKTPYLLKKSALLTGTHLTDARVNIDSRYNEPYVSITFDARGAKIFEKVTGENVKKRMAIVLDNRVYSAPVIQEKIPGGEARITGRFSMEEAHDLAIVLRAGALPASVKYLEERTVGPSLGRDSINKGLFSAAIGGILVIIFMVIFYKKSGLIADFALIVNILLIGAGLAAFQATLTLPGIAGIILTIGMAVDANVLIFERIKEELIVGKTIHAAVSAGYERATLTILDSNLTTLIATVVLLQFGTGPVKGFAVTLSLGVISSMFTALIVSRLIFDYLLINRKIKTLSI